MKSNFDDLVRGFNTKLKYYTVVQVSDAPSDDGTLTDGYGVKNKITGSVEHSSTMLPGVLWQATHFDTTLKSLLDSEEEARPLAAVEDIIPPPVH